MATQLGMGGYGRKVEGGCGTIVFVALRQRRDDRIGISKSTTVESRFVGLVRRLNSYCKVQKHTLCLSASALPIMHHLTVTSHDIDKGSQP